MKQVNLKGKFYGTVMRSVLTLLALILLLVVVPQATMLKNQVFTINKNTVTGVEIAKVLVSLGIVGVLLYFAYVSETQLPKITKFTKFKWLGLMISSVVHIAVIFIAYSYLLPFATDGRGQINQIFNAVFLILLCVPVFRAGQALYKTIDLFTKETENVFVRSDASIKCHHCGMDNESSAKFCANCGTKLPSLAEAPQTIICDQCNEENDPSAKFCANCGNKFSNTVAKPQTITCPQCNAENRAGLKHCTECGTDLSVNLQTAKV